LNFHELLHTMYTYVLNSVVKISVMFVKYFEYYTIILRGAIFSWTRCMLVHWMVAESVAGDHGGWLRSHRFVRSNWQRHTRLCVYRHRAASLERHAGKPAQTDRAVALAAGGAGEVACSSQHLTRRLVSVLLPLECCEPVGTYHHPCSVVPSPLCCWCRLQISSLFTSVFLCGFSSRNS